MEESFVLLGVLLLVSIMGWALFGTGVLEKETPPYEYGGVDGRWCPEACYVERR